MAIFFIGRLKKIKKSVSILAALFLLASSTMTLFGQHRSAEFVYENAPKIASVDEDKTNEVYVETNSAILYDTYMQAYFAGLTRRMGSNYKGSCTYVAIASILSYYDNFLNDGIVPDKYDSVPIFPDKNIILYNDSPGISDFYEKKDFEALGITYDTNVATTIKNMTASDYYRLIESKKDTSLHAKLITIGHDLGYYDINDNE